MEKTLDNASLADVQKNVSDVKVVGNGDLFKVLSKASSLDQGWMKSTKGMQVPNGVVIQVTTQQRNPDNSYVVAEALTFVPGVVIVDDENGGRKLAAL